jgi:hypothetical protein
MQAQTKAGRGSVMFWGSEYAERNYFPWRVFGISITTCFCSLFFFLELFFFFFTCEICDRIMMMMRSYKN